MILPNIPKIKLHLGSLGWVHNLTIQELAETMKKQISMIVKVGVLEYLEIGKLDLVVYKTQFEYLNKSIHLDNQINQSIQQLVNVVENLTMLLCLGQSYNLNKNSLWFWKINEEGFEIIYKI